MKVFVLRMHWSCSRMSITQGVYEDKEKAREVANQYPTTAAEEFSFQIDEFELNDKWVPGITRH